LFEKPLREHRCKSLILRGGILPIREFGIHLVFELFGTEAPATPPNTSWERNRLADATELREVLTRPQNQRTKRRR
jgi:hypothetical protein